MHPLYALPRIWNNSKLTCKYLNNKEDFLRDIRFQYFMMQQVNSCDKKFCKICRYEEWLENQKLNRNYTVKSTNYVRYSTKYLTD